MHVDRARAEEEVVRDLAVGAPDGDQAQHLELAAREARAIGVGLGADAEPLGDGLTEPRDLHRRGGRQRACAELAGRAIGATQSLQGDVALARGREHDAGAQLDLRALERHVEGRDAVRRRGVSWSAAVSASPSSSAVSAIAVRERGECVAERLGVRSRGRWRGPLAPRA